MGLPIFGAFYSIQYNQRVCNLHIIFIVNKQRSESVSDIGKLNYTSGFKMMVMNYTKNNLNCAFLTYRRNFLSLKVMCKLYSEMWYLHILYIKTFMYNFWVSRCINYVNMLYGWSYTTVDYLANFNF